MLPDALDVPAALGSDEALEILKAKKNGNYNIVKIMKIPCYYHTSSKWKNKSKDIISNKRNNKIASKSCNERFEALGKHFCRIPTVKGWIRWSF